MYDLAHDMSNRMGMLLKNAMCSHRIFYNQLTPIQFHNELLGMLNTYIKSIKLQNYEDLLGNIFLYESMKIRVMVTKQEMDSSVFQYDVTQPISFDLLKQGIPKQEIKVSISMQKAGILVIKKSQLKILN